VDVETPEQIVFSYSVAGVGSRAAAAAIDFAICLAALGALQLLVTFVARPVAGGALPDVPARWAISFLLFAQFAITWGYHVLWEGLRDGQTPGKRQLGLRVVQDGGYSVSFAASAVRNLVRAADALPPPLYGVGLVSVVLSKQGKRLGDHAAGTIVVHERVARVIAPPAAGASAGAAPLQPALSEDEYALLERFVARRASSTPPRARARGRPRGAAPPARARPRRRGRRRVPRAAARARAPGARGRAPRRAATRARSGSSTRSSPRARRAGRSSPSCSSAWARAAACAASGRTR
jgi:uncharacterized RDD family membrane protein YckC